MRLKAICVAISILIGNNVYPAIENVVLTHQAKADYKFSLSVEDNPNDYVTVYVMEPSIVINPENRDVYRIVNSVDILNPIYIFKGATYGDLFDMASKKDDWFAKEILSLTEFNLFRQGGTGLNLLFYYRPTPFIKMTENKQAPERTIIINAGDVIQMRNDPIY